MASINVEEAKIFIDISMNPTLFGNRCGFFIYEKINASINVHGFIPYTVSFYKDMLLLLLLHVVKER